MNFLHKFPTTEKIKIIFKYICRNSKWFLKHFTQIQHFAIFSSQICKTQNPTGHPSHCCTKALLTRLYSHRDNENMTNVIENTRQRCCHRSVTSIGGLCWELSCWYCLISRLRSECLLPFTQQRVGSTSHYQWGKFGAVGGKCQGD